MSRSTKRYRTSGKLWEFRDYHYRRDLWDQYREWSVEAMRILNDRLDVVGFWFDSGDEPWIGGSSPMELPHGSANVTWIIRWDDMAHRERDWAGLWRDEEWLTHWAAHPDSDGYLHQSARFMRQA